MSEEEEEEDLAEVEKSCAMIASPSTVKNSKKKN